MEQRELGKTGLRVSKLGFGAAPLGAEYGGLDEATGEKAVHAAIDAGINFFDTAPYYGRTLSESRLGKALKGRRDRIVLATKCARYDKAGFDFTAERLIRSMDESLERLQTDYIDLFQIHDVEFGDYRHIVDESLPALRKLQEQGKARFVGITGLSLSMLRSIAQEFPVDSILSYCRYNLINVDLETELVPFAEASGVGLINASPLHMRVLSEMGPPEWHPASEEIRRAGAAVVRLCTQHGRSAPDVALQFATSHPAVASTFVGISSPLEVEENIRALDGKPDPALLEEIERVVAPVRAQIWPSGKPQNYDPQTLAVPREA